MFEHILKVITKSAPGNDNDFADRLNYRYTAAVYMLMSMAVIGRTYIAEPIKCWTPAFFVDPWIDYTNNLCFVQSTYYLPIDVPIEEGKITGQGNLISYYQWIPLFFMMLAMCFYVPRAVWFNVFSHHFVDINAIVDLLTSFDNAVNPETRDPAVMQVAKHIDRYLNNTTEYRKHPYFRFRKYLSTKRTFIFYCGRRYGLAIATIYLSLKLCYIGIAAMQIYWIDTFLLGDEESTLWLYYNNIFARSYVIKTMVALMRNETNIDQESPTFPRITMCEFDIRHIGQKVTYNVQCVLPLNLFNEKIFLFLWLWIVFVFLMTCTNMVAWLWRISISWNRNHYIMKHLKLMGKLQEENMRHDRLVTKKLMKFFIHNYLRPDGVFLLRLISINTNCLISSEIIGSLWENFLDHPHVVKKAEYYHHQFRHMGLIRDEEEDNQRVLDSFNAYKDDGGSTEALEKVGALNETDKAIASHFEVFAEHSANGHSNRPRSRNARSRSGSRINGSLHSIGENVQHEQAENDTGKRLQEKVEREQQAVSRSGDGPRARKGILQTIRDKCCTEDQEKNEGCSKGMNCGNRNRGSRDGHCDTPTRGSSSSGREHLQEEQTGHSRFYPSIPGGGGGAPSAPAEERGAGFMVSPPSYSQSVNDHNAHCLDRP